MTTARQLYYSGDIASDGGQCLVCKASCKCHDRRIEDEPAAMVR